jgi:hypothetical protein
MMIIKTVLWWRFALIFTIITGWMKKVPRQARTSDLTLTIC